ncbi:serine hydrolase domain-containing protein [Streptomyces sp. SAI-041]|uniref:serine hydrolase domain-containing protein n=1 Tax=Streptomyces sp. SAI-041 TaxID=2940548 RepID=UPI0024770D3C|nr:serine hydrolase domain-containing protein [Streptomyces sp. SAI-041]MDH6554553.1 CubicO group peptidase (beta-lactamase class C family) [Streptomyces sp. SAI-041]
MAGAPILVGMMTSKELARRLSELAEEFKVVGASAALWHDGTLVRAEAGTVNVATGAPVLPDSLFAAGSVTKVFTASVAMTLVDEGLLDLEAPVRAYLPDFTLANPERSAAITVRMLLNHSSGLPGDYMPDLTPGDDVLERLMRELTTLRVTGNPGERWSYSNMGMSTLGRIIEVITGESYHTALSTRILQPLGLNATADAEELLLRSTAVGHTVDPATGTASRVRRLRAWPENGPAGSRLWLDVEALIELGRMHIDGTTPDGRRILSPEALRQMREPQFDDYWGCFPMYVNYGLGWAIVREGDDPVLAHGGANLGMHSTLYVLPKQKAVLAVLTNSTTGFQLYTALCESLLKECFTVSSPAPSYPPEPSVNVDSEQFTGVYQSPNGEVSVELHDGQLHLRTTPSPELAAWDELMGGTSGGGQPLPLVCIDSERHRFSLGLGGPGAFRAVQFYNSGADGRPTLIRVGTLYERTL